MNTNLTDLFNLKNLLNINNDQIDQSSNAQSISKKKQAAKAAPTKADVTPVPRAKVPILQLYVKTDSESNKPRKLALADNNEHNADESKFYPLVSSSSVIMDPNKWCEAIELYKNMISVCGSYILTSEQINSITTLLDKFLANEKAGEEPQNIFCVIDLINYMLGQAFATLAKLMLHNNTSYHLKHVATLLKDQWIKATDNSISYYTYDIDLSSIINQLTLSDALNTFDFTFSISPYEKCTSDYDQSNLSDSVTTDNIRSENITNMLLFSDYGITKIDEDLQNKKITVMAKKKPDIDITIMIMIVVKEVVQR